MPKAKSQRRILVIVASTHPAFEPDGLVLYPNKEQPVTALQAEILMKIPETVILEDEAPTRAASTPADAKPPRLKSQRPGADLHAVEDAAAGESSSGQPAVPNSPVHPLDSEPTSAISGAPEE